MRDKWYNKKESTNKRNALGTWKHDEIDLKIESLKGKNSGNT